jgi:hypothetical protein
MGIARFAPGGWFEQNKLACCRMSFDLLVPIVNLKTRVVSPTVMMQATNTCNGIRLTPYNWLTRLLVPELANFSARSARAQSFADMAHIAIALERYHLAHGNFPDTLDPLTPQFIEKVPHDVIGGQPLKYHRTENDRFVLYSVGWNERDDGGPVVLSKDGKTVNWKEGDWVWQLPPK